MELLHVVPSGLSIHDDTLSKCRPEAYSNDTEILLQTSIVVSNCRPPALAAALVKHLQNRLEVPRLGFRPFGSNCRNALHRVDRQRPHL